MENFSTGGALTVLAAIAVISVSLTAVFVTSTGAGISMVTGFDIGTANVTVNQSTSVVLLADYQHMDFGQMVVNSTNNTTALGPDPFIIMNLGSVRVDVDIRMNATLFNGTGAGNNSNTFRYFASNCTVARGCDYENTTFDWNFSQTTWANFVMTNVEVIDSLNYTTGWDQAIVEVLVSVPVDEGVGNKSSQVVLTGVAES